MTIRQGGKRHNNRNQRESGQDILRISFEAVRISRRGRDSYNGLRSKETLSKEEEEGKFEKIKIETI